jgi:small redox-active disulfide protein 2
MQIKVLGSGCVNCKKLEVATREVVAEMGFDASVEKVESYPEIMKYGVMSTPALVIDEKVVSSGRVPSKAELTTILVNAQLSSETGTATL